MAHRREVRLMPDGGDGWRFALVTRPRSTPRGGILFLGPFAEEMNRCRRQASVAARRFAADGWLVLQVDPLGTGDSSGDFGDATWSAWLDDVDRAHGWLLGALPPDRPMVVWTLRAGSLLASAWLARSGACIPLLLWQPVGSGRQALGTFLRLASAAGMLGGGEGAGVSRRLRERLESGHTVRVAGYRVSPALARGLEAARFELPPDYVASVQIFEVGPSPEEGLSPGVQGLAEKARAAGAPSHVAAVRGPRFWQTQEIETAPELVEASARFLHRIPTA